MKQKQTKTPGQRLREALERHWSQPLAGRSTLDDEQLASLDAVAAECEVQPMEVDAKPPTDGEPLPVTEKWLHENWCDSSNLKEFVARINAHRGVREVKLPQVTAAMWRKSMFVGVEGQESDGHEAAAAYLNAELARMAGKDGAE